MEDGTEEKSSTGIQDPPRASSAIDNSSSDPESPGARDVVGERDIVGMIGDDEDGLGIGDIGLECLNAKRYVS